MNGNGTHSASALADDKRQCAPPQRFVLRLDALPRTPAAQARVLRRVQELNRQLVELGVPIYFRVL